MGEHILAGLNHFNAAGALEPQERLLRGLEPTVRSFHFDKRRYPWPSRFGPPRRENRRRARACRAPGTRAPHTSAAHRGDWRRGSPWRLSGQSRCKPQGWVELGFPRTVRCALMMIRDYVERRGRLARRVTFWSMIGLAIGFALWGAISKKTSPDANIAAPVAILLLVFPVIEYVKRTRCLRCAGELSRLASRAMSRIPLDEDSCPHCGVSLDEPTDGPSREPMLDRIVTIRKTVQARAVRYSFALYVSLPLVFYAIFVALRWSTAQFVAVALGMVASRIATPAAVRNARRVEPTLMCRSTIAPCNER
jgi:hypothetical protein